MRIFFFYLLCLIFLCDQAIAQTTLTATKKLIVDDNGSVHAEIAADAWGAAHGIFFGSKFNSSTPAYMWNSGNSVYSHDAGPYGFGAFSMGYTANGGMFGFYDGGLSTGANQPITWSTVMAITRGGNIGISTETPTARLHVNGDTKINTYLRVGSMPGNPDGQFRVLGQEGIGAVDLTNKATYLWSGGGICGISAYDYDAHVAIPLQVNLESSNTYINGYGGQVGIGSRDAIPAEYKLGVSGGIIATKIKVKVQPWPDFVFEKDYRLTGLQEVEAFIRKNKHLPGILPAAFIEKDGLDLGRSQADLLQKIEELTLYLIEQDKQLAVATQKEKNLALKLEEEKVRNDKQQAELDELKRLFREMLNK